MEVYNIEIERKNSDSDYDTLYPQSTDDNVLLSSTTLGAFSGDTVADALVQLKQTVPSVENVEQATPSITFNSGTGLITATSTQQTGYVSSGTKTSTKQVPTKGAQTYTPTTQNQTIANGVYLTGTQTIKGDSNLVATNIKKGVSIFNVTGTMATLYAPNKIYTVKVINNVGHPLNVYFLYYYEPSDNYSEPEYLISAYYIGSSAGSSTEIEPCAPHFNAAYIYITIESAYAGYDRTKILKVTSSNSSLWKQTAHSNGSSSSFASNTTIAGTVTGNVSLTVSLTDL